MKNTKIEWCVHSWSPWRGCTKVSQGCANCYAEGLANRFGPQWGGWGKGKPRVLAKDWGEPVQWNQMEHRRCSGCGRVGPWKTWEKDLRRDSPRAVACCPDNRPIPIIPTVFASLCDWLDEEVPVTGLVRFLTLIHDTPNLRWLLLTKRPENWHSRLVDARLRLAHMALADTENAKKHTAVNEWLEWWRSGDAPPTNVWVGASVEDQTRADERIPALLDIPAVGRFLSVEPLLGPVNLYDSGAIRIAKEDSTGGCRDIDWVIVGGESGPGARPCNVGWIRSLVSQCKTARVPVFVKQLGKQAVRNLEPGEYHPERPEGKVWPLYLTHPKGGDPSKWPEDLRVREFPASLGGAR